MHSYFLRKLSCRNTIHFIPLMSRIACVIFLLFAVIVSGGINASAQDWIKTWNGLGVERIRIAVPDFKASTQEPHNTELLKTFNDTLWNDLDNAGIFDMVSKSFYPLAIPGNPTEVKLEAWSGPPPNAA